MARRHDGDDFDSLFSMVCLLVVVNPRGIDGMVILK